MNKQSNQRSFVDASREDASSAEAHSEAKPRVVPARSNNPQSTIANPAPFKSPVKDPEEHKPHDEGSGDAAGTGGGSPGGAKGGTEKPGGG